MYITEGDIENFYLQDIDSSYATFISSVIQMVESYIESYTGIDFENAASSTKYFDGNGFDELVIGDFQSITSVTVIDANGNTLHTLDADDDYWEIPNNEAVKNGIKINPTGEISRFPNRARAVKITGVFGYSAPPAEVKVAALRLAKHILDEGLRGGRVDSESLGSYTIDYAKVDETSDVLGIKDILDHYKVYQLGAT